MHFFRFTEDAKRKPRKKDDDDEDDDNDDSRCDVKEWSADNKKKKIKW